MRVLSSSVQEIKGHYEVVVIGSGYGGAIAASRLARAGRRVCLLERGKEFQAKEFPDSKLKALSEVQVDSPHLRIGTASDLYDFRVNKEINVFQGSGLGGTSLVNANVSLRPERRVFDDERWPRALRDDVDGLLDESYRHAESMLRPTPYPAEMPRLPKLAALEKAGAFLEEKCYRPPINVTFKDGVNHVGMWQSACTLCGDCVTGCNHTAKNTLAMNYLPDARNHGAEIFTEVEARWLERSGNQWVVHFRWVGSGQEAFHAPELFVLADLVVLGAGSLGSTEILLRSKERGLAVSEKVGEGFTGNGDVLAFAYNCDEPIEGVGWGWRRRKEPIGPCISGIIDLREKRELTDGMVIEEGVIPGALSTFVPTVFAAASSVFGRDTDSGVADYAREKGRTFTSIFGGAYRGAARNTMTLLLMAHDDGAGTLKLEKDRLRIDWPSVGEQSVFLRANAHLKQVARALGGTYLQNPMWSRVLNHHLITVHPLGGCCMGEDAQRGAVNHKGQVFCGKEGDAVYPNLVVSDGAVLPRPLGVNPLLTISAIAERSCQLVARDHGWTVQYGMRPGPMRPRPAHRAGLQFTETMKGFFTTSSEEDPAAAYRRGKEEGSPFEFTLTITSEDLSLMLRDPEHRARMVGTVSAPALSPHPITATEGEFRLFSRSPRQADTLWMHYRMRLLTTAGRSLCFEGHKRIHDDPGMDLWADTTTLYITLHEGIDAHGPVAGRGILHIRMRDFVRQMWTFRILNTRTFWRRWWSALRFDWFFAKNLLFAFGGPLGRRLFGPRKPAGRAP